jgi:signal transduction histidine kinase
MYERTDYVNGELSIESEPSKGTTVRLVVPMRNTATTQV